MNEEIKPHCEVLPAGTLPTKSLKGTSFKLKVDAIATDLLEIPEVKVVYPDGFIKWHQAESVEDLMTKIKGTLYGRFGFVSYDVTSSIQVLEQGYIDISNVVCK